MTRHTNKLKGLEDITEFLKIILSSGFIDDKPLSLILVAPISSGKTTAIKQFKNNKNLLITTDSTAYGLLKKYQNTLKNREIRHIIIPDLLNALARRKTTADALIMFINATSEDGIFPSNNYGIEVSNYIEPFGWVLCLTSEKFKEKKKFLHNIGFLSRFFTIEYKYSIEQIQTILTDIINEEYLEPKDIKIKSRKNKVKIKGNREIFKELETYSRLLCKESESEILRTQKKLQVFLKASAYMRNDKQVNKQDLETLKRLIYLIK